MTPNEETLQIIAYHVRAYRFLLNDLDQAIATALEQGADGLWMMLSLLRDHGPDQDTWPRELREPRMFDDLL